MTTSKTRAAALCALLATTCLAAPAAAQSATARPAYRNLDANGVDLTHGDFVMSFVEGSIGSGDGELSLIRNKGGNAASIWDGIRLEETRNASGTLFTNVSFGNRWEQFVNGATAHANGSTLTAGYTYVHRAADGTTITFTPVSTGTGSCTPAYGVTCTWLPVSVASPDGKTVDLSWDEWTVCSLDTPDDCTVAAFRLGQVRNSFGYSILFNYASSGQGGRTPPPSTWSKRSGVTFYNDAATSAQGSVSYAYPATNIVDVTDMAGRTWRFTNTGAQVTGVRRPGASADTTSVAYTSGQVSSVVRDGVTTNYVRIVSGNTATTTVTNALNQQAVVVSDLTIGRPTSVKDALNRTTSFQYDSYGRLTRVTDPEGNYVQYTLDSRGNITQTQAIAKPGSGLATITTAASFDAVCANPVTCNSPNSTTDARGQVTNYTYDPTHGGVLTVTAPAAPNGIRPQTRYGYTLLNGEYRLTSTSACQTLASCAGTADEMKATLGYDANGNVTSMAAGAGDNSLTATQTMTYDPKGDVLTVDGPLAGTADTTRYRYNGARELVGTVSPDPDGTGPLKHRAARNTINGSGLVTKVEKGTVNSQSDADWSAFTPIEAVEIGYDANYRKASEKLIGGGTVQAASQTSYDAIGRIECVAQRMNPATFGALPASACTLGTQGSYGPDRIVKAIYDAAGQVTQTQTAFGTAEQRNETTITYTNNGRMQTLTDAEGNKTTYDYDGHDRLLRTFYPSPAKGAGVSSATDYEQLGYDAGSNVTSRRLRDGQVIGYAYDNLSRLTFMDFPNSATSVTDADVTYSYDTLGRLRQAIDGNGHFARFTYDALSRTVSEESLNGGVKSLQYDLAGRRTRLSWPDGLFVTYDYLITGEMSAIRENGSAALATFGYDDLGRRTSLARLNGTVTSYAYDAASRLSSLGQDLGGSAYDLSLTFGYNPAGQIVTNTRSNDAYAFGGSSNGTISSPSNGLNQLVSAGGAGIAYDARGNLTSDGTATYGYNLKNQLVAKNGTTQLYYEPLGRLTEQWNGGGTLDWVGDELIGDGSRRYVHGPGADEPLVWYEGTSGRYFLHADERGSIVAVTNDAGNAYAINRYDEYGVAQAGNFGRFGYTGQAFLPEVGLSYYKARMYAPRLGRFMQTDPIGYQAGANLYNYVNSNPVNLTDPSGLAPRQDNMPTCTGTRISSGCGAGGISSGLSGFSSAGPGGQYATGEGSLNALGVDTSGMSGGQMRGLAAQFLQAGEAFAAYGVPRNAVLTWGFGADYSLSGNVWLAGGPKAPSNFLSPTNPPQEPPFVGQGPNGTAIRVGAPSSIYPNGYWRMYNSNGQAIDPSTGKPPSNVSSAEFQARTHIPRPSQTTPPPTTSRPWWTSALGVLLYGIGVISPDPVY